MKPSFFSLLCAFIILSYVGVISYQYGFGKGQAVCKQTTENLSGCKAELKATQLELRIEQKTDSVVTSQLTQLLFKCARKLDSVEATIK